jgi:hypothetical protein
MTRKSGMDCTGDVAVNLSLIVGEIGRPEIQSMIVENEIR